MTIMPPLKTSTAKDNMTAYDALPYPDFIHSKTDPNNLAALATAMGLTPPNPRASRVLEIACGTGANLISLATLYPSSHFVGFDLSARQIEHGQRMIDALEITNIELKCDAIETFSAAQEGYDYVLAHGVYSWVPDAVAKRLLELCREVLSANGIAFISYNTYPGWHAKMMIRELLHRQTHRDQTHLQRFEQGKTFIKDLIRSVPEETAYGKTLQEELHRLEKSDPRYVAHEQFEEINQPRYFRDFVNEAKESGLKYLCEANLNNLHRVNFNAEQESQLRQLPLVEREQQIDYFRRRTFRQSILTRDDVPGASAEPWGTPLAASIANLSLSSNAVCEFHPAPWEKLVDHCLHQEVVRFGTSDGIIASLRSKPTMLALLTLKQSWPCSMTCAEVIEFVAGLLSDQPNEPPTRPDGLSGALRQELLDLAISGLLEFHAAPHQLPKLASATPTAAPLTRLFAESGSDTPTQKHQSIRLDAPTRAIIQHADGRHSQEDLKQVLISRCTSGEIKLQQDGRELTEAAGVEQFISQRLPGILQNLTEKAIFIA